MESNNSRCYHALAEACGALAIIYYKIELEDY